MVWIICNKGCRWNSTEPRRQACRVTLRQLDLPRLEGNTVRQNQNNNRNKPRHVFVVFVFKLYYTRLVFWLSYPFSGPDDS